MGFHQGYTASQDARGDNPELLSTYTSLAPAARRLVCSGTGFTIDGNTNRQVYEEGFDDQIVASITVATDIVVSICGIGVHAPSEGDHWSAKIDNYYSDSNETWKVRDAVVIDLVNCEQFVDQTGIRFNVLRALAWIANIYFEVMGLQP